MNKKKVIAYLMITFAISHVAWWGLAFLTSLNIINSSQGLFTLIHVVGGFGPTIASIMVLPKKSPKSVLNFVFSFKKNSVWYLLLFCVIQALIIGLSSMEKNPEIPWFAAPTVMLSATFVGGGNEELGWRGIMQPELEKKFPFPIATLMTGSAWMAWHIPLWFVIGSPQHNTDFGSFCIFGLILSFWIATIHKKTSSVFFCSIFHGFSNLLMSFFVLKVNGVLIVGLIAALVFSILLYYRDREKKASKQR